MRQLDDVLEAFLSAGAIAVLFAGAGYALLVYFEQKPIETASILPSIERAFPDSGPTLPR